MGTRFRRISAVVFFLVLSFSVSDGAVLLDRVVAIVNSDVITWSELYKNMDTDASPQLKELKEEERRKIYRDNEESFLENLINLRLQLQEAKSLGMAVGDDEVKEAVENIKKKYSMTDESFRESLKKEGYSFEEYLRRMREQILIGKVVNQQVRNKVLVSEEDLKRLIVPRVQDGDRYRISQIFFKADNNGERSGIEEKAAKVLKKLSEGESFVVLAKAYSEDGTAGDGGDLGYIRKENLLAEFRDAIGRLKPGEVSPPFWTQRGLHIIMLVDKQAVKSSAELKEDTEKVANDRVFMERYSSWLKSLREKSFIEVRL